MTERVYLAYVCPVCEATWPHPSFKCSGIGGFADHPTTATVLRRLVDQAVHSRERTDR